MANFFTDDILDLRLDYSRRLTGLLCQYGEEDSSGDLLAPAIDNKNFAAFEAEYAKLRRETANALNYIRHANMADKIVTRMGY